MATLTATTFAQLVSLIGSSSDGDTIQLENDINLDREYPQGVGGIDLTIDEAKSITITGIHAPKFIPNLYFSESDGTYTRLEEEPSDWETNYGDYFVYKDDAYIPVEAISYKLINMRNAVGVTSWITTNGSLIFDHLDFQNIILNGCHWVTLDSNAVSLQVTHCRFTGTRSGESFLFNVPHDKTLALVSCAFDIPWQGMGAPSTAAALAWTALAPKFSYNESFTGSFTADYCRFHEHYTGWTVPTAATSSPSKEQFVFSCAPFAINGCYVYGDMTIGTTQSTSSGTLIIQPYCHIHPTPVISSNIQSAQNIIDVEITGSSTNSTVYDNVTVKGNFTSIFGIVRKSLKAYSVGNPELVEASGYDYINVVGKAKAMFVSDEQFADDEYLFKKGFDIIIKESE